MHANHGLGCPKLGHLLARHIIHAQLGIGRLGESNLHIELEVGHWIGEYILDIPSLVSLRGANESVSGVVIIQCHLRQARPGLWFRREVGLVICAPVLLEAPLERLLVIGEEIHLDRRDSGAFDAHLSRFISNAIHAYHVNIPSHRISVTKAFSGHQKLVNLLPIHS